jgi:hypothetical protein
MCARSVRVSFRAIAAFALLANLVVPLSSVLVVMLNEFIDQVWMVYEYLKVPLG